MKLKMDREFRVDLLRFDESDSEVRIERKPDKSLVIHNAVIGRLGIQIYRRNDGTIKRELRTEDVVFSKPSMASFEGKPFTNSHPGSNVTTDTFSSVAKGSLGDRVFRGVKDGQPVLRVSRINVGDAQTIRDIDNGKRELSSGYWADIDRTGGTLPDGTRFDTKQVLVRGNHVALVDKGRAGSVTRFDDAEGNEIPCAVQVVDRIEDTKTKQPKQSKPPKQGAKMPTISHRGVNHEVSDLVAPIFSELTQRADAADFQKARADEAQGKILVLEQQIKDLKAKPSMGAEVIKARLKLVNDALPLVTEAFKQTIHDQSDEAIILEVVKANGFAVQDGMSSDTVKGIFLAICQSAPKQQQQAQPSSNGHRAASDPFPVPGQQQTRHDGVLIGRPANGRGVWTQDGRQHMDGLTYSEMAKASLAKRNKIATG